MIYIRKASRFKAFLPTILSEFVTKVIMLYIDDKLYHSTIQCPLLKDHLDHIDLYSTIVLIDFIYIKFYSNREHYI